MIYLIDLSKKIFPSVDSLKCKNKPESQSGFTLIELVIVIAIAAIVAIMAYSLNMFGLKIFAKGDNQSVVQFDARRVADSITREVRFSSEVEILNSPVDDSPVLNDDCYIYMKPSSGIQEIKYKDNSGSRSLGKFTNVNLTFNTSGTNKTLYFNIEGEYKGQKFNVDSKVLPLNMAITEKILNTSGVAIRFNKTGTLDDDMLYFSPSPPNCYKDEDYSHNFVITGGTSPYNFAVVSGSLPSGIVISSFDGTLSGKPDVYGKYVFKIKVTDSSTPQKYGSRTFAIIIGDPALSADAVAEGITDGTYPFNIPAQGDTSLSLPVVPVDYKVVIESSSNTAVISLQGDITPQASDTQVTLVLKVISLVDNLDFASTLGIDVNVPASIGYSSPIAESVEILGIPKVGKTLTGDYEYFGNGLEGSSIFKWYRGSNADGSGKEEIIGAINKSYTPIEIDQNKYIFFSVKPVDSESNLEGTEVVSPSVLVAPVNTPPRAVNVWVALVDNGPAMLTASLGDTLYGHYEYADDENSDQAGTTFQWYRSNNSNHIEAIPGATGITYITTTADRNRKIYFEVIPRSSQEPREGVAVVSSNVAIGN